MDIELVDDELGPGSAGHDGAEKVPQPDRFHITWKGFHYGYRVSIPNYEGGEAVKAEPYDALREAVQAEIHRQCAHCRNGLGFTEDGRAHYGYAHQGVIGIVRCLASPELRAALHPQPQETKCHGS